jgi:hypothetical protein
MGFDWWLHDKNGKDLFAKADIHYQALDLGPNTPQSTDAPHRVGVIREAWVAVPYKEKLTEAAQDALREVQRRVRENLDSLKSNHCDTCTCGGRIPVGWSVEACLRFLKIDPERVHRGGGGW